jgi:MFS family permease
LSALGSGLATIAAPLFVAAHTESPLVVAATSGAAWLPWLLFALPGGVLVDRVDRRLLMVIIDWARVVLMGGLATALLAGWSSIAGWTSSCSGSTPARSSSARPARR